MNFNKKTAFIISNPKDIDYYIGVLWDLDPNDFELVYNDFRPIWTKKFIKEYKIKYKRFTFRSLSNVYFSFIKYEKLFSTGDTPYLNFLSLFFQKINLFKVYKFFNVINYKLDFQFRKYFKLKKNVRKDFRLIDFKLSNKRFLFPRGYDLKNNHPGIARLQSFNFFLCHGPIHKNIITQQTIHKTVNIGYPRYDYYINSTYSKEDLKKEFKIKNDKKIIFWLPAYRSSKVENDTLPKKMRDRDYGINFWLDKVKEISDQFNIIIRPHPDRNKKNNLDTNLQDSGLFVDKNTTRSLANIYRVVDFVFCEISGPFFSAIYNKNKILVLDHQLKKDLHHNLSKILEKYDKYYKVKKSFLEKKNFKLSYYLNDIKFWESQRQKTLKLFSLLYEKNSINDLKNIIKN